MNEKIRELEEKIAFLEHHVTEQDKVMLGFAEDLARLRRELTRLAARASGASSANETGGGADEIVPDERPPHY